MFRKTKYKQWKPELVFLGTLDNVFDLYFCPKTIDVYSYYGDSENNYFNGMYKANKDGLPSLHEALKRAKKRKLL